MMFQQKPKVFCIGHNKTGTTSMGKVLTDLGFRVGSQKRAERLLDDWGKRDFEPIVRYCRSADAFQDVPFSLDYTFQAVDQAFPGSRFILTIRDSPEQWFDSLRRYHSKVIGTDTTPTAAELRECPYHKRGWLWRYHELVFGADERTVFDKDRYCSQYTTYNNAVQAYFAFRRHDLLVINLTDSDASTRLSDFLTGGRIMLAIPHLNRNPA